MVVTEIFNFLFGWTLKFGMQWGLFVVCLIINLITTLVYKYFTNQEALKKIKEDHKKIQEEMKVHKDNPAKVMQLQKEALSKGLLEPMKHQLKPMLILAIPFILIFNWLKLIYGVGDIIYINIWFIHTGVIGTYIIYSIIFGMIFRKILNVQ